MADISLTASESVSVSLYGYGGLNPMKLTASESITLEEIRWFWLDPSEQLELMDDTEFEGPYGEIQNFTMRR